MKKMVLGMAVLTMSIAMIAACGQDEKVSDSEKTEANQEVEEVSVAGTYSRTYTEEINGSEMEYTDTIVLKEDNTCEMTIQDTIAGTWSEDKITLDDGNEFEFNVEGDTLKLNRDGEWITYNK